MTDTQTTAPDTVADAGQADRSVAQLHVEALNARECDDAYVEVMTRDLEHALAEHRDMREQLAAYLDGDIPPYRGVAIPDMTDADRIRALRNLLDLSIRLQRKRRTRYFKALDDRDAALALLRRLAITEHGPNPSDLAEAREYVQQNDGREGR